MGIQQIRFDIEKEEFYVENTENILRKEVKTKLPLSTWNLVKELDGLCAIVVREYSSPELEEPTKFTYYKVPLKFAIKPDYKNYYLVSTTQGGNDDMWQKTTRVFMRNLADNTTVLADIPQNPETALAMPYKVQKLKSTKLSKTELKKILLEGSSIGVFRNLDLLERIVT